MRSRAYTEDAGKSSVTMLKVWPTPLRIRTSPINRTRNLPPPTTIHHIFLNPTTCFRPITTRFWLPPCIFGPPPPASANHHAFSTTITHFQPPPHFFGPPPSTFDSPPPFFNLYHTFLAHHHPFSTSTTFFRPTTRFDPPIMTTTTTANRS